MTKIWKNELREKIPEQESDTVYYDGACPLCSKEVCNIRSLGNSIGFIDIHSTVDLPRPKTELLRTLHLFRANGEVLKGLDANIIMWRYGSYPWLSWLFSLPLVYSIAGICYKLWSNRRYNKLYG